MGESPCRSELRARMMWCARWLLGGNGFYRGPVKVVVRGASESLAVHPAPGDELYDGVDGPGASDRLAELAPKLLASFLSPDGLAVLRFIASKKVAPAKAIVTGSGVERSKCYVLLTDLRERGLICDTYDGYEIANNAVWRAIESADALASGTRRAA